MSISAFSSGLSGLQSNQAALDVSANNVANVSTNGFQPQRAAFQESSPAGGGVTLSAQGRDLAAASAAPSSAGSGTDLASDITNSLVYKAGFDLSAKVIQASDDMLGSLINTRA